MTLFNLNAYPEEQDNGENHLAESPRRALDLNAYPEEHCRGQATLDLNAYPEEQDKELVPGLSPSIDHVIQYTCKKELTNDMRKQVYEALVWRSKKGKLKGEVVAEIAASFSVSTRTVRRIWKQARDRFKQGYDIDISKRRYKCGRKRVQVDLSLLHDIPVSKRTTLDDLARHSKVSKSTLWKLKKEGQIKRHSNSLKPLLKEQNKKERLRWCISMLDPTSIERHPIFKDFFDTVFIDEKWFYLTKKTGRYYILPDEEEPIRTCKNRNYIPKVMFLCAIARPRIDTDGNRTFDGKIGFFPLVTYERARRTSKNRVAGTLEMKPIMSITKEVIRSFIIDKVLPAIRAKWPSEDAGKPIYIQQDNARPHINPSDPSFCEAAQQEGFDIRLVCQPPNSPDFNILDLGFFAAIQSIQYKEAVRTVPELVTVVQEAFQEYSPTLSNRIFSTLQLVMIEAMKAGGGNNYKIPHVNKALLEREIKLPTQWECDLNLVQQVCRQVDE